MEIFKLVFSPIEVNTYILADKSGDCAVIDCGCYTKNEFDHLVKFLDKHKLKPVLLLNTHCHLDHIFGNGMFLEKYKIGTLYHKDDEMNRQNAVQHASLFGLTMAQPPEPTGYITDGQVISSGNITLKTLLVPGHTSGGVAFYCENDDVLFSGDTLFANSIGRTDLEGGDFDTIINSIKSKLFTLPPETVVYPGHGGETTIGREIKSNPWFVSH